MYAVRGKDSRTILIVLPTTTEADLMRGAEFYKPRARRESGGEYYEIMRVPDSLGNYSEGERANDPKTVALERLVDALFTHAYMVAGMVCPQCRGGHIVVLEGTRFWSCSNCGFEGIGDEFEDRGTTPLEAVVKRTIEIVLAELTERRLLLVRPEAGRALFPLVLAELAHQEEASCSDDAEKPMACPQCGRTYLTEVDNLRSIWMCNHCGYKGAVDCFLVETTEGEEGQD
jgi:ribosomal protein L37AE/L43A